MWVNGFFSRGGPLDPSGGPFLKERIHGLSDSTKELIGSLGYCLWMLVFMIAIHAGCQRLGSYNS